ncbi:protein homooligomerization [Balamuthia mandrillaris]
MEERYGMQADELPPLEELQNWCKTTAKTYQIVSADLAKHCQLLQQKEAKLKALEELMEENFAKAKERVVLDVGGKRFATSKSSFLRFKESFFWAMLANGHWQPDADGSFFIDRDPKHFSRIINYLRSGQFDGHCLDAHAKEKLKKDFEFYLLPLPPELGLVGGSSGGSLQPQLAWDAAYSSPTLLLSQDRKTATKTMRSRIGEGVVGTHAVTEYSVHVRCGAGDVMVGLALREHPNGRHHAQERYYLSLPNGALCQGETLWQGSFAELSFTDGDQITIRYDAATQEIRFAHNGEELDATFIDVQAGLFPAVELRGVKASVSLV